MILYEAEILHFAEDLKRWKERYIVVKNDYAVECFENKEAFQKGVSPKYRILPVGGKVLTSEEDYNLLSEKHFPDPLASNEKEPPFVQLPKEFPVFLWQAYLRHSYYCFEDPDAQKQFSAVLNDCVRHLNHDYLKQTTYEVQAFLEAVQFFRQEKGHYGVWEMITGNEIQILSNLVMEELLPNLQTMILPKMKGRRNYRKRTWFGIVEETYNLVQEQVSEGLSTLKGECEDLTKSLEGTVRSDVDQILNSTNFLAGKIKATVSEPAQKCCTENIQPFLASILEELMGPVSSGFSEVRCLFEKEVNEISRNFQKTNDTTQLTESLEQLRKLPLDSVKMEPCYLKVNLLQELLQDLKSRFKFYYIDFVIQKTQNFMQELMENAVYTFGQLFSPNLQGDIAKIATAIEKVKLRVLKQYDYDSSTVRKKIFQEALVEITLPTMQKTLASLCKPELQKYEQFIFADYTSVIQVENVYEEILYHALLDETLKVIKEAASLKKHNLFEDSLNMPCESVSSLTDLKTPSGSTQTTPAKKPSTTLTEISDTETQNEEVLVLAENISQEECYDAGKANNEGTTVDMPNIPENISEKMIFTDTTDKKESQSSTPREEEAVEEKIISQNENTVEAEFGGKTEKESQVQEEAMEEKVTSKNENEVEAEFGGNTEKDSGVPEEAVEMKLQEHGEECDENSKNKEEGQADKLVSKEVEHTELKMDQPFSSSLGTDDVNVVILSEEGQHGTQAECSETSKELGRPQEANAEVETNQSVWYTDKESCEGLDNKLELQELPENVVGDRRSDLEEEGVHHTQAGPVEAGAESFADNSAESPDATRMEITILRMENLRIEVTDVLEKEEVNSATPVGSKSVADGDECKLVDMPSSAEITTSMGSEILAEESREGSCTEQCSE
uniref:Niban apoptosis regulator 1 n=1 Tax=Crocodylus porosus TaxID=8502 RepID=A0A7M4F5J8_CROPO